MRTMFSRLLTLTDVMTGFDTPLSANAALKALRIAKGLMLAVL